jgi:hypothetical protein
VHKAKQRIARSRPLVTATALLLVMGALLSAQMRLEASVSARDGVSAQSKSSTALIRGIAYHGMWTNRDARQRAQILDSLHNTGINWVRMDVAWASLQPDGPGEFDPAGIAQLDQRVAEISQRGLRALIMFWWGPQWSTGTKDKSGVPSNPDDYADAVAWVAQRYSTEISAIEIWNEPDLTGFFASADPLDYAELLKASYARVKQVAPDMTVVAAAPTYLQSEWYESLYAAGAKGHFDALGAHPYPRIGDRPPKVCRKADSGCDIASLVSLMSRHGDSNTPIWVTEFGWSTHADRRASASWERGVNLRQQARYTAGMLEYLRSFPQVDAAFTYRDQDFKGHGRHQNNFGLLDRDGQPKPAHLVMACVSPRLCGPSA